jgi:hypothetical protein
MKTGYIYCSSPDCEVEIYCIDIEYKLKDILRKKNLIYYKKIVNPERKKNKLYNKFNRYLLINNLFSCYKKNELINYIKML